MEKLSKTAKKPVLQNRNIFFMKKIKYTILYFVFENFAILFNYDSGTGT
jgi:hypothetical protein